MENILNAEKFVSWACSTYGRPQCVPEVIRMFLEQNYKGKKELVLLNDDPDVNYVFNHPEVRIYNWNTRFLNVRTKHNQCVDLCNGEVFISIPDDDLWKPHATTTMINALGDDPYVAINGFWKKSDAGIQWVGTTITGLYACRVDFYKRMGGYPAWIQYPFGDLTRDKSTSGWMLHPECFMEIIRESNGYYKEFKVESSNGFFIWARGQPHFFTDITPDKYVVKNRNPEIIEVKL